MAAWVTWPGSAYHCFGHMQEARWWQGQTSSGAARQGLHKATTALHKLQLLALALLFLCAQYTVTASAGSKVGSATDHHVGWHAAQLKRHSQRALLNASAPQHGGPVTSPAADATTTITCSIVLTAATASITCGGPPGLVSVHLVRPGLKVTATSNVKLADPTCTASVPPAAQTPPEAANALPRTAFIATSCVLRVCSSATLLVLTDSVVSGITIAAAASNNSQASASQAALSVVALTGSVTLQNCTAIGIRGGAAVHLAVGGSSVRVLQSRFARIAAGELTRGGGLVVVAGSATRLVALSDNQFVDSSAGGGAGAYLHMGGVGPGAQLVLNGSNQFEGCTSLDGSARGSALSINGIAAVGLTVSMLGTPIFAANNGSAVVMNLGYSQGAQLSVAGHAAFVGNSYSALLVAAPYSQGANITVAGSSTFVNNTDTGSGGGLYANLSNSTAPAITISGTASFVGNGAGAGGGGLWVGMGNSTAAVIMITGNTSFMANSASVGGGAFVSLYGSKGSVVTIAGHARFQANVAAYGGGGAYVYGSSSNASTVLMTDSITFNNNAVMNSSGGGTQIDFDEQSDQCAVVITGSATFQGNQVHDNGGAVALNFNTSLRAVVRIDGDTRCVDNRASLGGGGVYGFFGNSTAANLSIGGRTLFQGNAADLGGGVMAFFWSSNRGIASVTGKARFHRNVAALDGGGVWLIGIGARACTADVSGSVGFINNSATAANSSAGAAGLFFSGSVNSTVSVGGSAVFRGNSAGYGGAVSLHIFGSTNSSALVTGSVQFLENRAGLHGGGAYVIWQRAHRAHVRVTGRATFVGNVAGEDGAGVACVGFQAAQSSVEVSGQVVFKGNHAYHFGGALSVWNSYATAATVKVGGSVIFMSNIAGGGGATFVGLYGVINGTAVIGGSPAAVAGSVCSQPQYLNNTASTDAGAVGVAMQNATSVHVIIQHVGVVGNAAGQRAAGVAVYANTSTNSSLNVADCCFRSNIVRQGMGGGMVAVAGPPMGNESTWVQVTVVRSQFVNNTVLRGNGGGMVADGSSEAFLSQNCIASDWERCNSTFILSNTTFTGNRATLGAGLWAINTQCHVSSTSFVNNTAAQSGGGALAKGVTGLVLQDVLFDGNRAQDQGGGLTTQLGDDFEQSRVMCRNCTFTSNSAQVGGGANHVGGNNTYLASTIVNNSARQRGGGLAYFDVVCAQPQDDSADATAALAVLASIAPDAAVTPANNSSSNTTKEAGGTDDACRLRLANTTTVSSNEAPVGGGLFLGMPDSLAVSRKEAEQATARGNTATYSNDVAVAPGRNSLTVASISPVPVPSSTAAVGATGLVVLADQSDTRLQVEFCNIKQRGAAYLTGIEAGTTDAAAADAGSSPQYAAHFEDLRLMHGIPGQKYCLRVLAPDFPLVNPLEVNLTIRECDAGEQNDPVAGCTPCPANQYAFTVNGACANCNPSAQCLGGARFVPRPGFWHSSWNSSNLYRCPYKAACRGAASAAAAMCQANGSACSKVRAADSCRAQPDSRRGCYQYSDLLCAKGYTSKLCLQCADGYGSTAAFRCGRCQGKGAAAVYLLLACILSCCIISAVGIRAVMQQHATRPPALRHAPNLVGSVLKAPAAAGMAGTENGKQQHRAPGGASGGTASVSDHASESAGPSAAANAAATACPAPEDGQTHRVATSAVHGLWPWCSAAGTGSAGKPQQPSADEAPGTGREKLQLLLQDVEVADVFKVLVVYAQYIGILRNLVVDWPRGLLALMAVAKVVVAPGSSDWVSLDCLGRVSSGALLWLRFGVALLVVLLASLLACALATWGPGLVSWVRHAQSCGHARRRGQAHGGPTERGFSVTDATVATVVAGLFSVYASLVTTSMSAFACMSVDDEAYWVRDPDVRCWTHQHAVRALVPGLLGLLVLCVGVPVAVVAVSRHRDELPAGRVQGFDRRYGFLYRPYRPECRYWEALLCFQTMALVAVDQFARQVGALYQLVAITVVLFAATAVWIVWHPFRSTALTQLYLAGTGCLQLTCLLMMVLLRGYRLGSADVGGGVVSDGARAFVGVVIALLNCAFVLASLLGLGYVAMAPSLSEGSWLRRSMRSRWMAVKVWVAEKQEVTLSRRSSTPTKA